MQCSASEVAVICNAGAPPDRSRLEAAAEAPIKGVASPFAKRPIISFCEAMLRRDIVAR
jgi:hypothetical protein